MQINTKYNYELSEIGQKAIFTQSDVVFHQDDFRYLKDKKILKFVDETLLPDEIVCEVIVFLETPTKAKVNIFNNELPIPLECFDEPILNRDLINGANKNGGKFWLEFMVDLKDELIELDFKFEN